METMFRPKSVAILGASTDESKIGGRPLHYLKHYEFDGPIYPINPKASEILGRKCFKSISEIPGDVALNELRMILLGSGDCFQRCGSGDCLAEVEEWLVGVHCDHLLFPF